MRFPSRIVRCCALIALVTGVFLATDASAMPMFARKYDVECSHCHTTIPRLNETGYKFRAAGFRLLASHPIGQPEEEKFDLGHYLSARIQARYDTQATNQPNGAPIPNCPGNVCGPRTVTNALSFMEATLYPLTGSWGKYFASESELSFSPEDVWEVENAYVRMVRGNDTNFFTSRVGVFHPWEGFGASDRPLSNARPLFQTSPLSASGRGVPSLFQPWGLDEVGAEVGGDLNQLSIRGAILGGTLMRWEEEANTFLAFPAQTGPWRGANQAPAALGKPYTSIGHNSLDFSANATYILHPDGGGASFIYYHGQIATPTQCVDGTAIGRVNATTSELCGVSAAGEIGLTDFDFTDASAFTNHFDRIAFYGSYPVANFLGMAGYQYGWDETPVNPGAFTTDRSLKKFHSNGLFAEGSYNWRQFLAAGIRYDRLRPNTANPTPQWAVTPYVNIPFNNGFQLIAEYQHRDFKLNASTHRQNDTFQVRIIFIQ